MIGHADTLKERKEMKEKERLFTGFVIMQPYATFLSGTYFIRRHRSLNCLWNKKLFIFGAGLFPEEIHSKQFGHMADVCWLEWGRHPTAQGGATSLQRGRLAPEVTLMHVKHLRGMGGGVVVLTCHVTGPSDAACDAEKALSQPLPRAT